MDSINDLTHKKCKPYVGGELPLTDAETLELLEQLDGWELNDNHIGKTFEFKNYYQVISFVNAVAWMTHNEDHHPNMMVGFNQCRMEYSTHAIGGLSENDFICAAKADALFQL